MDEDHEMPELLATLFYVPEDLLYTSDEDLSPYYTRKWSFNIYRTAYGGPECDRAWEALVDNVRTQIRLRIEKRYENELEVESAKKLMALSRPSLHSDPNDPELRDASLDRLRQIHADNIRTGKALPN